MDLQERVAQQVTGMAVTGQDVPGELTGGGGDTVAVGVGGRAADVLPVFEGLGVIGEDLQAVEPVLEGVFVGEP